MSSISREPTYAELRADRDEWREQHENLLALYQQAQARIALVAALTPDEFGTLVYALQKLQLLLSQLHDIRPRLLMENIHYWAQEVALYLGVDPEDV